MKHLIFVAAHLLTLVVLFGCGGVPPTYYYRIHDSTTDQIPASNGDAIPVTLGIAQCTADLLYESDKIVFRDSPYQVQFYHYRRWIGPPRRIVTEKLYKDFRSSGVFEDVVQIPTPRNVDYILRGRILAFEELDEGSSWFGLVSLELQLYSVEDEDMVWDKVFTERTPAEKRAPVEVVKAISSSLATVIQTALGEISENLKTRDLGSH